MQDCKEPKDQAKIDENYKAWKDDRPNRERRYGPDHGKNRNQVDADNDSDQKKGRGRGRNGGSNRQPFGAAVISKDVTVLEGMPHMNCARGCGLNTTHSTGTHSKYAANPSSFILKASYPLALAKAILVKPAGSTSGGSAILGTVITDSSSAG